MSEQPINGRRLNKEEAPADAERQSARERARARPYESAYGESARRPSTERPNSFNALAWLLEGASGFWEELRHSDLGLSEEFWVHAYAARRESLLALRALLDELIAQTENQAQQEAERQKRRERRGGINIDF